jgi:hypothetical protein
MYQDLAIVYPFFFFGYFAIVLLYNPYEPADCLSFPTGRVIWPHPQHQHRRNHPPYQTKFQTGNTPLAT